jgi:hypothetical protein
MEKEITITKGGVGMNGYFVRINGYSIDYFFTLWGARRKMKKLLKNRRHRPGQVVERRTLTVEDR